MLFCENLEMKNKQQQPCNTSKTDFTYCTDFCSRCLIKLNRLIEMAATNPFFRQLRKFCADVEHDVRSTRKNLDNGIISGVFGISHKYTNIN